MSRPESDFERLVKKGRRPLENSTDWFDAVWGAGIILVVGVPAYYLLVWLLG